LIAANPICHPSSASSGLAIGNYNALGMTAMRMQIHQTAIKAGKDPAELEEPRWRPFQLGFLLVALASTVDEKHDDRELVLSNDLVDLVSMEGLPLATARRFADVAISLTRSRMPGRTSNYSGA
jgi:hypothetical protein